MHPKVKVVTSSEMSRIETLAYSKGANERAFMERAGKSVAEVTRKFIAKHRLKPRILLLCGRGNNAGDAFVAGQHFLEGTFRVKALSLASKEEYSPLVQREIENFLAKGGEIQVITCSDDIAFEDHQLLIDGLFGTGFKGEVTGLVRELIEKANHSGLPILSIDIPSGVDGTTGAIGGAAIQADITIFLGLPKSGCFIGKAFDHVGEIALVHFGLGSEYTEEAKPTFYYLRPTDFTLPPLIRTRHKYEAGYVVGLGGSPGMAGAALLTSKAALRSGAGIVRLMFPAGMESEFANAPLELIRESYSQQSIEEILAAFQRASALFIGPGIGKRPETGEMLSKILPLLNKPTVIDADALFHLAQKWVDLPPHTILTPHLGEMKRLLHLETEIARGGFLDQCRQFSDEKKITLLLKGAPTFIFHPGEIPHLVAVGDPGMATAGSGDVLTGIIAALLAQGKSTFEAAALGALIHGLSGERAALEKSSYGMIASDLIEQIPTAFKEWPSL